jgi:hypothetical protein
MRIKKYTIEGIDLRKKVLGFFSQVHQEGHISKYGQLIMVYSENYSWWANNNLLLIICYDFSSAEEGTVSIEFVAGGGKAGGWLGATWGNEGRRVDQFEDMLYQFCKKEELTITSTPEKKV